MNNEDDYVIIRDYVISLIRDFFGFKGFVFRIKHMGYMFC